MAVGIGEKFLQNWTRRIGDAFFKRLPCADKHLHRYRAEFDFRYSNRIGLGVDDQDRADTAIWNMVGKRLTYRQSPSHSE
jgi:hypothetical protein